MSATSNLRPGVLSDLQPDILKYFSKPLSSSNLYNKYIDQREVGHGSFGAVYYAVDVNPNYHSPQKESSTNIVAIKKMSYSGKQTTEKWQDIIQEILCLSTVQSHENVVGFYTSHLVSDSVWLVMEYCIGSTSDVIETLDSSFINPQNDQNIDQNSKNVQNYQNPNKNIHTPIRYKITESDIAAITAQTLKALSYLHSKNIIHRDIKAGNILLHESVNLNKFGVGKVKLADFGSACNKNPANSFVGSPYWMSPEIILAMEDGVYDDRTDIWSLGITCIELAEKRPPYFNINTMSALYQIAQNNAPRLKKNKNISSLFYNFVADILTKDVNNRPRAKNLLNTDFINSFIENSEKKFKYLVQLDPKYKKSC